MKKVFFIILCAILTLTVCACKAETANDGSTPSVTESTDKSDICVNDNTVSTDTATKPVITDETGESQVIGTYYKGIMADDGYKEALLLSAEEIDKLDPGPLWRKEGQNIEEVSSWYDRPYQYRYYYAQEIIQGYAYKNGLLTDDELDKWAAQWYEKQNNALGNPDDYWGTWEFIRDFDFKYEDFKDEFIRVKGMMKSLDLEISDEEVELMFNGTKEEINKVFIDTEYSVNVGDKIYTPFVITEKLSFKQIIEIGITPDDIGQRLENLKNKYYDTVETNWYYIRFTQYKQLCDDVYKNYQQGKIIDTTEWVKNNLEE